MFLVYVINNRVECDPFYWGLYIVSSWIYRQKAYTTVHSNDICTVSADIGERSVIVMHVRKISVCLWICLSVCLSVNISNHWPQVLNFTIFSVRVADGSGSIDHLLLALQHILCMVLPTSCFHTKLVACRYRNSLAAMSCPNIHPCYVMFVAACHRQRQSQRPGLYLECSIRGCNERAGALGD